MADDRLKNFVLSLADIDYTLSEQARLVVLAALEGSNDLAEVLGDDATSSELVESLTTVEEESAAPVGAYLRAISVQGFRGIGAEVTLPFRPGPGLTVLAGRNGSGKSMLAEGLELALTGKNSRWNDKAAVWSQNWRNLHAGDPAHIRVDIAEERSGATTIGVDWPAGEGVDVDDFKAWVQRDGKKREDTSVLGWAGALEMYRPLLSYDELGGILEGRPSDFYDQLHKLLGLEQLTEAMARLDAEVKQLKQPSVELRKARDALRPKLESHEDPRTTTALAQLKKRRPERRLAEMLFYSLNPNGGGFVSPAAGLDALQGESVVDELREVIDIAFDSARRSTYELGSLVPELAQVPLEVHASYSREEILSALGFASLRRTPSTMREGVAWCEEVDADAFLITLKKSDRDYSPTTMYRDFALSPDLFHWESQSTTSSTSPTGQRYIHHRERGSHILLFVRQAKTNALGASPYVFLGPADYISHEGDRPMAIT